MKWYCKALIALFVISLTGSLIWSANHYHSRYKDEQKRADDAEQSAKLKQATIDDMQVRQRDVAALDARYTKELADAQNENGALRRKLDNGGRVLVKGKCPVLAAAKATAAPGMDDGGTIELSAIAGRNVFDIRAGISKDQLSLRGLQDYIRQQCLK